jgi:hypothetical protein
MPSAQLMPHLHGGRGFIQLSRQPLAADLKRRHGRPRVGLALSLGLRPAAAALCDPNGAPPGAP